MHKIVSFPLIKAWFHRIFQRSWKWGSFICRSRFRRPCKRPRRNFICLHAVSHFAYFAGFHPQSSPRTNWNPVCPAQPSSDARDRRMRDTHCWEYGATAARWQGNKATCQTCSTKGVSPSPASLALLISYVTCVTSSPKFRNQIESPNVFTICIKPSHRITN